MKLRLKEKILTVKFFIKFIGAINLTRLIFVITFASILEALGIASIGTSFGAIVKGEGINTPDFFIPILSYFKSDPTILNSIDLLLASLALLTFTMILNLYSDYCRFKVVNENKSNLSIKLFEVYIRKPYSEIINLNSYDLGKNILVEVDRITNGVLLSSLNVISSFILMLTIATLLAFANIRALITVCILLSSIYFLIYWGLGRYIYTLGKVITVATAKRFRIAVEGLQQIKLIKVTGIENQIVSRFSIFANMKAKYGVYSQLIKEAPRHILQWFIFFAAIIAYLLFSSANDLAGTAPTIAIFSLSGYKLLPAIQKAYIGLMEMKQHKSALDLMKKELFAYANDDDFENKEDNKEDNKENNNNPTNGDILFSRCCLQVESTQKYILEDINLKIKFGSNIAIIGESGAGKSSLLNLLLGLLKPSSGTISINNNTLHSELSVRDWNKSLGYVPQSVFLIDDSIKANIALMLDEDLIDYKRMHKASKISQLDQALKSRNCDLSENVGDKGIKFSGGQVQRIGIARALYRNPSYLILDESTSAVDAKTEKAILSNIFEEMNDMTVISVTHRSDLLDMFDTIITMKDGKVDQIKNITNFNI